MIIKNKVQKIGLTNLEGRRIDIHQMEYDYTKGHTSEKELHEKLMKAKKYIKNTQENILIEREMRS